MTFQDSVDGRGERGPVRPPEGDSVAVRVPNVAMLIDWDNFYSQCAERGVIVRPARLKEVGRSAGRLRWSAVFVDATRLSATQRIELFTEGFDICDCPKLAAGAHGVAKDTVDAAVIGKLHALADFLEVEEIILGTADRDYLRVVQHLRDSGKRVRIMTPTPRDRPTLVQHSDGAIAYAPVETTDALARDVAGLFGRGVYVSDDPRAASTLRGLADIVVLLDGRFDVNRRNCGFRRIIDELLSTEELRGAFTPEALKERLEFLIDREVIIREQDDRKYYRYRVSRAHPFTAYAHRESRVRLIPARTSPEDVSCVS